MQLPGCGRVELGATWLHGLKGNPLYEYAVEAGIMSQTAKQKGALPAHCADTRRDTDRLQLTAISGTMPLPKPCSGIWIGSLCVVPGNLLTQQCSAERGGVGQRAMGTRRRNRDARSRTGRYGKDGCRELLHGRRREPSHRRAWPDGWRAPSAQLARGACLCPLLRMCNSLSTLFLVYLCMRAFSWVPLL